MTELMEIELVKAIPELEHKYRAYVHSFISNGNFTLEEWNSRFKYFRDDIGYSIIHYFEAVTNRIDIFLTLTKKMIENREELEKRFGVKIITPDELMKDAQDNKKVHKNNCSCFDCSIDVNAVKAREELEVKLCKCGHDFRSHYGVSSSKSFIGRCSYIGCKCLKFVKQNKNEKGGGR